MADDKEEKDLFEKARKHMPEFLNGEEGLSAKQLRRALEKKLNLEEKALDGIKDEIKAAAKEYIEKMQAESEEDDEEDEEEKSAPVSGGGHAEDSDDSNDGVEDAEPVPKKGRKRKASDDKKEKKAPAKKKSKKKEEEDEDVDDTVEPEKKPVIVETITGALPPKQLGKAQARLMSEKTFLSKAEKLTVDVFGNKITGSARVFTSGNKGWYLGGKVEVPIAGRKKPIWGQLSLNLTIVGSKEW